MLVQNFTEMKKFLPSIEMKGAPTIFDDALETAQDDLVSGIIGTDLEELLEARNNDDSRLLKLCQRVIAIEAFLTSIPEMDLVLTDSGFGVVSNQDIAPASKERVQALKVAVSEKLDAAKDRLITFLMGSEKYSDWKGTEEFARLSDGLIFTFAEFKDLAVYNRTTSDVYPKSWSEFFLLNSALNVALTTHVASYISNEYAMEILEKLRDGENFLPKEKLALKIIKIATAAFAMGDTETGTEQAIKAALYMAANPEDFPTFTAYQDRLDLKLRNTDTPIFSMF